MDGNPTPTLLKPSIFTFQSALPSFPAKDAPPKPTYWNITPVQTEYRSLYSLFASKKGGTKLSKDRAWRKQCLIIKCARMHLKAQSPTVTLPDNYVDELSDDDE